MSMCLIAGEGGGLGEGLKGWEGAHHLSWFDCNEICLPPA